MTITELIAALEAVRAESGDLPVYTAFDSLFIPLGTAYVERLYAPQPFQEHTALVIA